MRFKPLPSSFDSGREHANQITSEMMTSLGGQWYSCGGFAPGEPSLPRLKEGDDPLTSVHQLSPHTGFIDLNSALEANSNTNPPPRPSTKPGDKLCLIYTRFASNIPPHPLWIITMAHTHTISGTTGAPKAAVITHGRFISVSILYSVFLPKTNVFGLLVRNADALAGPCWDI